MSTNVTATRHGATPPAVPQGMHPLFHELFVAPRDGDGGPGGTARKRRTRTAAVRTVRAGISRGAAQGTWA